MLHPGLCCETGTHVLVFCSLFSVLRPHLVADLLLFLLFTACLLTQVIFPLTTTPIWPSGKTDSCGMKTDFFMKQKRHIFQVSSLMWPTRSDSAILCSFVSIKYVTSLYVSLFYLSYFLFLLLYEHTIGKKKTTQKPVTSAMSEIKFDK